jgi:3-deoxy-D-manno-octulosonic-acid transferase
MSDRSAPRYAKAKFFFKEPLSCIKKIFAQSDLDAKRYIAAGAMSESVVTSGSFKFDAARRNPNAEKAMSEWIGEGRILLGGSTWPGEENVLLDAYKTLLDKGVDLKLVIAPRHFEKADAVEANIRARGFSCARRSRGDKGAQGDVYLADTTGELMGLYAIAESVFVGKSLFAKGSQNMIEPCFFGKRVVVGPHTQNFRPVMDDLLSRNAIIQVSTAKEVEETIVKWFLVGDGGLGDRAKNAVQERLGVVSLCAKSIMQELDSAS